MSPTILGKYTKILESLTGKMTTNMSKDDMVKFISKNLSSGIDFEFTTYAAEGTLGRGECFSSGKSKLSVVNIKDESISKAQQMIKDIYEAKKETTTTTPKVVIVTEESTTQN
jgi:hypothetical protein